MKTKIKIPNASFFEKLIEQSKSIYARTLLYFISFIEAIFFPIPNMYVRAILTFLLVGILTPDILAIM